MKMDAGGDGNTVQHHALEFITDEKAQQIEDHLWWMLGRKNIIRRFLTQAKRFFAGEHLKIMDVGCGSGGVFDVLAEFGEVFGAEPSPILARRARLRGIASTVFEEDVSRLEFTGQVDIITMFDVLEHIEHDVDFLRKLRATASEDHLMLISVPACQFLFGEHDTILHHYRRYSSQTLKKLFLDSDYEVIKMSYFMFFLFPFVIVERCTDQLMKLFGKQRTAVDIGDNVNPFIGNVLARTLAAEAVLSKFLSFPIGLWLFALVRPRPTETRSISVGNPS